MTRLSIVALVIIAVAPAFPTRAAEPAGRITTVTFEDADVEQPPKDFTIALTGGGGPVSWLVREEVGAPSGTKVLVQASADTTNTRFPLCIYDAVSAADVTLSVKFKAISGTVDQAAGLVWRYQNPNNYYIVRANALEGNVVLYKVENGKRSDIDPLGSGLFTYGKKAPVTPARWQQLKVEAHGSRFKVYLDDVHLFDVEDSTFKAAGKVGLWTKADSVTAFDDLVIETRGSDGE